MTKAELEKLKGNASCEVFINVPDIGPVFIGYAGGLLDHIDKLIAVAEAAKELKSEMCTHNCDGEAGWFTPCEQLLDDLHDKLAALEGNDENP